MTPHCRWLIITLNMNNNTKKAALTALVFFALVSYMFFFRLGSWALTDPDETFYAQSAKEMLQRHEWSTPYLYGEPQFEKPVLFYWLVEGSFKLFGVNETAARLPSAVCGAIGILAIYLLGKILFNKRVGAIAALMLATCVEYIMLSRACVTDMTLFTLLLLGTMFFFYGHKRGKNVFYVMSAAAFGLAFLTKGPIALILPFGVFIIYLTAAGEWKSVKKMPLFLMACAFIVVSIPWYLVMYKLHGNPFLAEFFGFRNVNRFLVAEHAIGSQFYYNIPIILGGFFPWSVFLPVGFWYAFKNISKSKMRTVDPDKRKGLIFALAWFVVIFLFFTASSTKLPTYIFPCFISIALLTAVVWDDFLSRSASPGLVKWMNVSYAGLLAIVVIGTAATGIYIRSHYPTILTPIIASLAFLVFGVALSIPAFMNGKRIWTLALIAYSVMLFMYPMSKLVLPVLEGFETSKVISEKLLSLMKPGEDLGSESRYMEGLAFYTDKFPVNLDKHHNLINFLNTDKRVWFVMKEKNHRQIYELDTAPLHRSASYEIFKIGKRSIITNDLPAGVGYLVKRERKN